VRSDDHDNELSGFIVAGNNLTTLATVSFPRTRFHGLRERENFGARMSRTVFPKRFARGPLLASKVTTDPHILLT
jgi:hypothetical protein